MQQCHNPDRPLSTPLFIEANGQKFEYFDEGDGPTILFLHGFPDHAATWRPLLGHLGSGFRILALNQRGYGQSTRPVGVENYRVESLVADLTGILDTLGLTSVHVCGHDWGGVLAFELAKLHPDRVASLIVFNAPPSQVLQHMITFDPDQRAASNYIGMLRSQAASDIFKEDNIDALIERFLGLAAKGRHLDEADIAEYRRVWTYPGVWQAMLSWYRAARFLDPEAALDAPAVPPVLPKCILPPTLVIWGDADRVFIPAMADVILTVCASAELHRFPTAGHVPHREFPEHSAKLVADFVSRYALQHTD